MSLRDAIVKSLVCAAPRRLLALAMRLHYRRLVRGFPASREPDIRLACAMLRGGDVAVDVGANIGIYTKFVSSRVGAAGLVLSIEPVRATFDVLCSNVRSLKLNNVRTYRVAISEVEGDVLMEIPKDSRGIPSHYLARIRSRGATDSRCDAFRVSCTTIDRLIHDVKCPGPALIKIDVEGHELACIKGATATLERHRPALLIEIWTGVVAPTSEGHQLAMLLNRWGYRPYVFDQGELRQVRRDDGSRNYWFLTDRHRCELPCNLASVQEGTNGE